MKLGDGIRNYKLIPISEKPLYFIKFLIYCAADVIDSKAPRSVCVFVLMNIMEEHQWLYCAPSATLHSHFFVATSIWCRDTIRSYEGIFVWIFFAIYSRRWLWGGSHCEKFIRSDHNESWCNYFDCSRGRFEREIFFPQFISHKFNVSFHRSNEVRTVYLWLECICEKWFDTVTIHLFLLLCYRQVSSREYKRRPVRNFFFIFLWNSIVLSQLVDIRNKDKI